jgi:ubiquinone/menaquinone biosynthesis C-methylase UbiE
MYIQLMTPENAPEVQLQKEFNRWAEDGRAEEMESHHRPITDPMLELMQLRPDERVLDVGSGSGWFCRQMASLVPQGSVAGVDVSDEMVRRAKRVTGENSRVTFATGTAEKLPAPDGAFTRVVSVESAYYWPDPARGLREIFRVLAPGGSAWVLINYYHDNPHCHQWGQHYSIPAQLLWAKEWAEHFRKAGFVEVSHRRIPDRSPTPDAYSGRWFRDVEQLRQFKAEGALLITGTKP